MSSDNYIDKISTSDSDLLNTNNQVNNFLKNLF